MSGTWYWLKLGLHLGMAGIVYPSYLIFLAQSNGIMYWQHIVFWIIYSNGIWLFSYRKRFSLQILLGYMLTSAGFLFVVSGRTIPIELMIAGLTGGLVVVQHIILYGLYRYPLGKSILFSSQVMTVFLGSSIVFGFIYIMDGTVGEGLMMLGSIVLYWLILLNTFMVTLYLYRLPLSMMLGVLTFGILCVMVSMRLLPLGHITQALLVTIVWVYSVSLIYGFFTLHERYIKTALGHGVGVVILVLGLLASEVWPMI